MKINSINQTNNTNPNFKASVKFSKLFYEYYTDGKLREVTKSLEKLGSPNDSIELILARQIDSRYYQIYSNCKLFNGKEFKFTNDDESRYALLRKVLEQINQYFSFVSDENSKDTAVAVTQLMNKKTSKRTATSALNNKQNCKDKTILDEVQAKDKTNLANTTPKGLNKELEYWINKKIDEKFEEKLNKIIESKLNRIIEAKLEEKLKKIDSNKNIRRFIRETIKNSNEEVAQALIDLIRDVRSNRMNPSYSDFVKKNIIAELHNELAKLINGVNDDYQGGYYI